MPNKCVHSKMCSDSKINFLLTAFVLYRKYSHCHFESLVYASPLELQKKKKKKNKNKNKMSVLSDGWNIIIYNGDWEMTNENKGIWSLGTAVLLFFFFCLFRAAPAACGSSQARGQIGAVAAGLHHSLGNAGSLTHWAWSGIEPVSSWDASQIH